ncbi:DUF4760 domain-containing protein [Pseudomonas glycinae]|uniref:DUF4760 domain-containing protein n=1 Tax=Pseudomonas glycinae TaxID=1785145 RepID=UPI001F218E93|nr:DUF4760 domain-containing protein [Pseudomonas glycinae]
MLFKLMNRYKYVLPVVYFVLLACLLGTLSCLFYKQITCEGCSIAKINPSSYLMPIIAYLSIGLAGITIGFTRKTASEKNALEFEKEMSELKEHFQVLYKVRQEMLLANGRLDRRKATAYMEDLCVPAKVDSTKADAPKNETTSPVEAEEGASAEQVASAYFFSSSTSEENESAKQSSNMMLLACSAPQAAVIDEAKEACDAAANAKPKEISADTMRASASAILNAMEGCANAVRYGIYDEDFIYNIYGSHFIEIYELTYGFVKARQIKQARLWVNFEWLAVKWTLRRNITGVISKESVETSYIINQALNALKEHNKTRPVTRQLKKFEAKLERRKFPM